MFDIQVLDEQASGRGRATVENAQPLEGPMTEHSFDLRAPRLFCGKCSTEYLSAKSQSTHYNDVHRLSADILVRVCCSGSHMAWTVQTAAWENHNLP